MEREEDKPSLNDETWFDALSGKEDTGQGARLRKVLREVELAEAAQEDTEHDWQRLQFALKRERSQQAGTARSSLRYFALAASVLILVGTVTLLMPMHKAETQSSTDEAAVMRGQAAQVILSDNPEHEAKLLQSELARLGVKVIRRDFPEKTQLHITLSYPVKVDVRAVLEARIISVPEQGDLSVVFIKSIQ